METNYVYLDLKIALNVKLLLALSAKLQLFVPLCGCEINSDKNAITIFVLAPVAIAISMSEMS